MTADRSLAPIIAPHLPRVPTWREVDAAARWGFNCGPAALCAVTGSSPESVRAFLPADWPGYTNPTAMGRGLGAAGMRWFQLYRGDQPPGSVVPRAILPGRVALTRVQWGGPWTRDGVPFRARYRQTHWIAESWDDDGAPIVYDVNAVSQTTNGWIPRAVWVGTLVPWLLRESVPKADGRWWPTHVWEVLRG